MTEKWIVLTPVVEGSVPLLDAAINSARRKPVWTFVAEGVKMDLSFIVTSRALVVLVSNFFVSEYIPGQNGRKLYQRGIDGGELDDVAPF